MKYFLQTVLIIFIATNTSFAQVNVESSTGNMSIGSLSAGAQKLNLFGPMTLRHPNTTDLGFIRFANSSNTQLGYLQFTNPSILNDAVFQLETDFGDIEIDAKEEMRFLINDNFRAGVNSSGLYLPQTKYLGWEEGVTRKAYVYYNGTNLYIENDETFGDLDIDTEDQMRLMTNDITRIIIQNDGKIGIATNTPAHTLQVNGNIGMTGEILGVSDIRTKKNIKEILYALEKVKSLRAVSYEYKDIDELNAPVGPQLGFIAQELETILPELVSLSATSKSEEGEEMHLKGINYVQLIPLLTKAIQQQDNNIQEIEHKLSEQDQLLEKQSELIKSLTLMIEKLSSEK